MNLDQSWMTVQLPPAVAFVVLTVMLFATLLAVAHMIRKPYTR